MPLTATVITRQVKAGVKYTIGLSNGLIVKRQSSQPKAAIGFHLDIAAEKGCRTTVSKDINTLRRDLGGREGFVIVDLETGEVTDCSELPKHVRGVRRTLKADSVPVAFQKFAKSPERLANKFKKSAQHFASIAPVDADHGKELSKLVSKRHEAAGFARSLIGDTASLLTLWNEQKLRTGGDLESLIERTFGI